LHSERSEDRLSVQNPRKFLLPHTYISL
jgi:hypothetical protein